MNWFRIYYKLIDKARNRNRLEGYSELHHIVPRCLSGSNDKDNLVRLTAKEHYIAHRLLSKMNPKHVGLSFAANRLGRNLDGRGNKQITWNKGKKGISEETRKKMALAKIGNKNKKGKKVSDVGRKNISKGKIGNTNKKGTIVSEIGRKNMSDAQKRRSKPSLT